MITIYTDGSCLGNPGPGGMGIVMYSDDFNPIKIGLYGNENTTNNLMELNAAYRAIKILHEMDYTGPITIITDSNYVVKGMTEWMVKWQQTNFKNVKNKDDWQRLYKLASEFMIDWKWVKGHNKDYYNEMADNLARTAAETKQDSYS